MEAEHTETVVEKVTHYVKEMLGIPEGDGAPDVEAKPAYSDIAPALHFDHTPPVAPELSTLDAMRIEPGRAPEISAAELNAESARREDGAEF
jgi:hypothetical protein